MEKQQQLESGIEDLALGAAQEASEEFQNLEPEKQSGLLVALFQRLDAIDRKMALSHAPATWSVDDIAVWLGLSKYTVDQRVVVRPGFPKPIVPGGIHGGMKRWFADEVIEWFRINRGTLQKGRNSSAKPRGRPRQQA